MNVVQLASGRPPTFIGNSRTDAQYWSAKPVAMPVKPPHSTSFGSTVRFWWMIVLRSSIGTGVYASTLVKPCAIVLRAAVTTASAVSYSAITPCIALVATAVCAIGLVLRLDVGLRQQRLYFEDRNHRHEAQEQQERGQEQAERAGIQHEVPLRRRIMRPRRGHEVVGERRHDDHEALEPHADADDQRHDEQQAEVLAYALEPQQLHHADVDRDQRPVRPCVLAGHAVPHHEALVRAAA